MLGLSDLSVGWPPLPRLVQKGTERVEVAGRMTVFLAEMLVIGNSFPVVLPPPPGDLLPAKNGGVTFLDLGVLLHGKSPSRGSNV